MAGNPFLQSLDPAGAPGPVTPADGPSDAAGFAMVTPGGRGTAWYDVQAANDEAAITAAFNGANALTGAGVLYPEGPRQREAQGLLDSPQGFSAGGGMSGYDIMSGWSGEPDESWQNDVQPVTLLQTPVQGAGDYPGTMQDGIQTYGC